MKRFRTLAIGSILPVAMALAGCRAEHAISLGEVTDVSMATNGGSAPSIALSRAGRRAVSWVATAPDSHDARLYVSVDGAEPTIIADTLGAIQSHAEAPPQLAFDHQGLLYVVYVVTRDAGKRFPESALRVIHSLDNGKSWTPPATVTDDRAAFGAHNFHSIALAPDGRLYVSWLDGLSGAMEAYFTSSNDAGATWSRNTKLSVGETCPCCHTSIVAGKNGAIYAVWRAVFPGNFRDIVVARSTDYGATWGAPVRVHEDGWAYAGCPHAGPSVQVDGLGRVHVLWWTGSPKKGGVWFASSRDSAKTFSAPLALAEQLVPTPTHVQLGVDVDNDLIATWDDAHGIVSTITARVSKDGGRSFARAFAISDSTHDSQYPVVAVNDNAAFVAWSQGRVPSLAGHGTGNVSPGHGHGQSHGQGHSQGHNEMPHSTAGPVAAVLIRDIRF